MKAAASVFLIAAVLSLQGCVAAVLPLAAAGMIGKTQIDAEKRTRNAEKAFEAKNPPLATSRPPIVTVGQEPPETVAAAAVQRAPANFTNTENPYLALTQYALAQSAARESGQAPRAAVLVENVSLTDPKAMTCGSKPMAVAIDVDEANGAAQATADGLAEMLVSLREAKIRIAWISNRRAADLEASLKAPAAGLIDDNDLRLPMRSDDGRKQERRWDLAKEYCVIAMAGDTKSDFDELYDYLRVPEYAIMLDKFWNRGWFMVPSPLAMQSKGAE